MSIKSQITAQSVAHAFLHRVPEKIAKDGNGINSITLHKLLFFAQEEYLFKYEEPLFKDKILAKEHGMTAENVVIEGRDTSEGDRTKALTYRPLDDVLRDGTFPIEAQKIIRYVWSIYGVMSAWYLEELTHSYEIWKDNVSNNLEITINMILEYKQKIEKARKNEQEKIENIFNTLEKNIF